VQWVQATLCRGPILRIREAPEVSEREGTHFRASLLLILNGLERFIDTRVVAILSVFGCLGFDADLEGPLHVAVRKLPLPLLLGIVNSVIRNRPSNR
jgi:hypothetical protein